MKIKSLVVAMTAATVLVACGEKEPEVEVKEDTTPTLETLEERLSYIVGSNVAQQFQRDEIVLDSDAFLLALKDAEQGVESRLDPQAVQETIQQMQAKVQAKREAEQAEQQKALAEQAEKNKADGEAYLAENANKEGVTVTDSGLQYEELVAGEGAQPSADDTVSVHYKGTLIDGTEFDSSYSRGEPATFPVSGVIPGWVEALQLMQVGDKWKLAIPSDLAYGPGGTGSTIGPNATLIFEVELLDVIKPQ